MPLHRRAPDPIPHLGSHSPTSPAPIKKAHMLARCMCIVTKHGLPRNAHQAQCPALLHAATSYGMFREFSRADFRWNCSHRSSSPVLAPHGRPPRSASILGMKPWSRAIANLACSLTTTMNARILQAFLGPSADGPSNTHDTTRHPDLLRYLQFLSAAGRCLYTTVASTTWHTRESTLFKFARENAPLSNSTTLDHNADQSPAQLSTITRPLREIR
jgi:hypothetical protein